MFKKRKERKEQTERLLSKESLSVSKDADIKEIIKDSDMSPEEKVARISGILSDYEKLKKKIEG